MHLSLILAITPIHSAFISTSIRIIAGILRTVIPMRRIKKQYTGIPVIIFQTEKPGIMIMVIANRKNIITGNIAPVIVITMADLTVKTDMIIEMHTALSHMKNTGFQTGVRKITASMQKKGAITAALLNVQVKPKKDVTIRGSLHIPGLDPIVAIKTGIMQSGISGK